MKRIDLLCVFCLLFLFAFSQENHNQSTYSHEGTKAGNNPGYTKFNGFEQAKSQVNDINSDAANHAADHRQKAIWADNSSIVSDEKTGRQSTASEPQTHPKTATRRAAKNKYNTRTKKNEHFHSFQKGSSKTF